MRGIQLSMASNEASLQVLYHRSLMNVVFLLLSAHRKDSLIEIRQRPSIVIRLGSFTLEWTASMDAARSGRDRSVKVALRDLFEACLVPVFFIIKAGVLVWSHLIGIWLSAVHNWILGFDYFHLFRFDGTIVTVEVSTKLNEHVHHVKIGVRQKYRQVHLGYGYRQAHILAMNENCVGHGTPIRVDGCLEGMREQKV